MNKIIQKLNELGYQTINENWYSYVDMWDSWYKGTVAKFHDFKVWNGQKHVKCRRYTLGMSKKVSEDWANLLMNEKVKITLEGKKEQEYIDGIFRANDFEVNANELMEKGAARGTYAIIPHVAGANIDGDGNFTGGGNIIMDYVTAGSIYPITWRGREITECAFSSVTTSGNTTYTYLQIHVIENGQYVIYNRAYSSVDGGTLQSVNLSEVKGYENVQERISTGGTDPQFVIGRYNISNNLDDTVPMGISVYANAMDVLKGVDKIYDSYINEFDIGKRRVMVKPSVTKQIEGENVFDPDDLVFYVLPEDVGDGTIIQPIDMSLRTVEHNTGLQDALNMLSSKCGFGERHYRFDSGNVSTATQIISENSEMFRTIKKHEIVLESFLIKLCRILLRMGNAYMGMRLDEGVEISVDFDDSIITDAQADMEKTLRLLEVGLMKPDEARSIIMNEDIETARAALPAMRDMVDEQQNEIE